jgi:hypothetical protein
MTTRDIARALRPAFVALALIVVPVACGEEPYTDGACGSQLDCPSFTKTVCGSAGECVCPVEGERLCCPGGLADCGEEYQCRPAAECEPVKCDHPPEPECQTAEDCRVKAPDLDLGCGSLECVGGTCSIAIDAGKKLSSDYPGDCKRSYCDILGRYVELVDPGDVPFDDNPCTFDKCEDAAPKNEPLSDGVECPNLDDGVCFGGKCVECALAIGKIECGDNVCLGIQCGPMHCTDNVDGANGDETDHNCGGSCAPCSSGATCASDDDCISHHCVDLLCETSTHSDDVKNDGETGADCGCAECLNACDDGEGCLSAADCLSRVCYAGTCQPPTCDDGAQNGTETGKDCGGDCPQPCSG